MSKVKAEFKGLNAVTNRLKYDSKKKSYISGALFDAAQQVQSKAVESIQTRSAGRTSVRYNKAGTKRVVTSAAKGKAPNTDLGGLVEKVAVTMSTNKLAAYVTSRAKYSAPLEYGNHPFMRPALEKSRKVINKIVSKAIRRMFGD